jgi:hypothetical protein
MKNMQERAQALLGSIPESEERNKIILSNSSSLCSLITIRHVDMKLGSFSNSKIKRIVRKCIGCHSVCGAI